MELGENVRVSGDHALEQFGRCVGLDVLDWVGAGEGSVGGSCVHQVFGCILVKKTSALVSQTVCSRIKEKEGGGV